MKLPALDYRDPATAGEAIRLLSEEQGSAKVVAGGAMIVVIIEAALEARAAYQSKPQERPG